MRYITSNHPDHPGTWCVCEDGRVLEVLVDADQPRAVAVLAAGYDWQAALTAAGDAVVTWEADPAIAYEGVPTSDRRQIDDGATTWRQLPLPYMQQTETAWGHDGAVIAGAMDEIERRDGGLIWARGRFDTGEMGVEAARLVGDDIMRGVSVDVAAADVETEILERDEDGWPTDWLDHYTSAELMGVTGTPFPAFADARIRLTSAVETDEEASDEAAVAAGGGPLDPPTSWFENPNLTEPTPLTITEEGRVYGHLALWGTCHIGRGDACVTPPRSQSGYSYYATGVVRCEDGCEVPVGLLTFNTGHAGLGANHREAAAHYDHTGTGGARLAVHEDAFGPVVAGALCSGLTDEQVATLRSSSMSGDWRRIGGSLELVAILAVNVPGYPVPRTRARTAAGEQFALVAAAGPRPADPLARRFKDVERRLAALEAVTGPLHRAAAEALDQRLHVVAD